MSLEPASPQMATIGRYVLHSPIASGGMATVYFGRALGPVGFRRIVAIKRMHPHLAQDPEFVAMFLDEASLAARIQHPNVAATIDVVAADGEVAIVMEYIRGESLGGLLRASRKLKTPTPIGVAVSLIAGTLNGLHAAHEARGDDGQSLGIIHRDVSPPNILIGLDGMPRLVDFGVAKAASRLDVTREGQFKGKIGYAAPEQLLRSAQKSKGALDRRVDIFAAGSLLWELLAGRRLFQGDDDYATMSLVIRAEVPPLTPLRPEVSPELEAAVRKALARDREDRYATAEEFALAIEAASPASTTRTVSEWVKSLASDTLARRDLQVQELENSTNVTDLGTRKMANELARASRVDEALRSEALDEHTEAGVNAPSSPASSMPGPVAGAVPTSLSRRIGPVRTMIAAGAGIGALVLVIALAGRSSSTQGAASSSEVSPSPPASESAAAAPVIATTASPSSSVASDPAPAVSQTTSAASAHPSGRFPPPTGTWHPQSTKKVGPTGTAYVPERL